MNRLMKKHELGRAGPGVSDLGFGCVFYVGRERIERIARGHRFPGAMVGQLGL